MKTIAFFNNKGGVGKTSMVYHLAWMFRDMGHSVLAVDLDPQSNLTSIFLDESEVEKLWPEGKHADTILGSINLLIESLGDIENPKPIRIAPKLSIIAGDLGLSTFEDRLSEAWRKCTDDNAAIAGDGFRVVTAFPSWRGFIFSSGTPQFGAHPQGLEAGMEYSKKRQSSRRAFASIGSDATAGLCSLESFGPRKPSGQVLFEVG